MEVIDIFLRGYARGSADVFAALWTEALADAAEQSDVDPISRTEALVAFDDLLNRARHPR